MNLNEAYLGICEECGHDLEPVTPLQVDDSSDSGRVFVWVECSLWTNHPQVWVEPEYY